MRKGKLETILRLDTRGGVLSGLILMLQVSGVLFYGCGPTDPPASRLSGRAFKDLFPVGPEGYTIVFMDEKPAMSRALIKSGDRELARVTIRDLDNDRVRAGEYVRARNSLSGYPMIRKEPLITAVMVNSRYEVEIQSLHEDFSEEDRKQWIGRIDLNALAR